MKNKFESAHAFRATTFLAALIFCAVYCHAQGKNYKEYDACIASEVHKGKLNHGKSYCVGWATIREYKGGRKDTIDWTYSGKTFGEEYEQYQRLPERGKYIIDSLKEDGIPMFQNSYLTYEPIYMRPGKKTYKSWIIQGEDIAIYYYSIWNNSSGNGTQFLKGVIVK